MNEVESLVFPQDYKFSADPAPFTFKCVMDGRLIKALVGMGTTSESAETAGARGKLLAWLETNGPASKTTMKKAGFGWESLTGLLDGLVHAERVEILPGRKAGSSLYLVRAEPSSLNQDGTPHGADDAL